MPVKLHLAGSPLTLETVRPAVSCAPAEIEAPTWMQTGLLDHFPVEQHIRAICPESVITGRPGYIQAMPIGKRK